MDINAGRSFRRGDFVWGKMKGFSWWPAFVLDPDDIGKVDSKTSGSQLLFWFGDHRISRLSNDRITPFKKCFDVHYRKNTRKDFVKAVDEALAVLAEVNDFKGKLSGGFAGWANAGFESVNFSFTSQCRTRALPKLISTAISEIGVQSDSQDEGEIDIRTTINKIRKGEKMLDDVCIGCCREKELIHQHPIFIGQVCLYCKKDIDRISALPVGKCQKYCTVCGVGGMLVYCSIKTCKRAYCEECIQYLDSKEAFSKITSKEVWSCYDCQPVRRAKCLIKMRSLKKKESLKISSEESSDEDSNTTFKQSSSTPPKIAQMLRKVLDGAITLEELCIGCCEEDLRIIDSHPLLVGGICGECHKDVTKICRLPCGKFQKFCIVCGQGGLLVFCSDDQCSRAYCKPCIEWLDGGPKTFKEIELNEEWVCYLCEPSQNPICLIKRRYPSENYMGSSRSKPVDVQRASTSSSISNNEQFVDHAIENFKRTASSITELSESSESNFSDKCSIDEDFSNFPRIYTYPESSVRASTSNVKNMKRFEDGHASNVSETYLASTKKVELLNKVLNGATRLQDICISCCENAFGVIDEHPLLIGGVCVNCKDNVIEVNRLSQGKLQKLCTVCGKDGLLVFCIDDQCLRAYCKTCIIYLDNGTKAFNEIELNEEWLCYVCQPSQDPLCLIKAKASPACSNYISSDSISKQFVDPPEKYKSSASSIIEDSESSESNLSQSYMDNSAVNSAIHCASTSNGISHNKQFVNPPVSEKYKRTASSIIEESDSSESSFSYKNKFPRTHDSSVRSSASNGPNNQEISEAYVAPTKKGSFKVSKVDNKSPVQNPSELFTDNMNERYDVSERTVTSIKKEESSDSLDNMDNRRFCLMENISETSNDSTEEDPELSCSIFYCDRLRYQKALKPPTSTHINEDLEDCSSNSWSQSSDITSAANKRGDAIEKELKEKEPLGGNTLKMREL